MLIDFSCAVAVEDGRTMCVRTGTRKYRSPEAREGRPLTVQSDIYTVAVGTVDAVGGSDATKTNQHVELKEAETVKPSEPGWIGEVREADEGEDCTLVGMYSRCRLLSGPWSVKRRLEAARIRGDTEEEERLTELLEEVVCEALEAE